jgi:hypothetical protein
MDEYEQDSTASDATRDAKGRFVAGHPKLPGGGRPKGSRTFIREAMCSDAAMEAFRVELARRMERAAKGKRRDAAWLLAVLSRGP